MFDLFENPAATANSSSASSDSSSKTFVVSIGGSAIIGDKPNTTLMAKLATLLSTLHKEGHQFAIVVGGGKTAREYIAAAKTLGANNFITDMVAIRITRANALLLIQALEGAYPEVQTDILTARAVIDSGRIPVFGGLIPGFTTDTVAALLSEFLNATFVNLTNVDGVYNADPRRNKKAVRYDKLSYEKLWRLIVRSDTREPGANIVLDSFTCAILKRSKIKGMVLAADDLSNLEACLRGQEFKGTTIQDEGAESGAKKSAEDDEALKDDLEDVDY